MTFSAFGLLALRKHALTTAGCSGSTTRPTMV